jgi:thiopeptide-type bacteriocin biosynthesis protein
MSAASRTEAQAFAPTGFCVLRTPLLPFGVLSGLDRARLLELIARPAVREALFVAAPALEERLEVWQREPESEAGGKIELALVRYLARMAGRATPFGLFAGCAVGAIGERTHLLVPGRDELRRHTRLDMDYVAALIDALGRDPALRNELRFVPNPSLYRVAGRLRYLEVRREEKGWSHHRAALEVPGYLDAVLTRAASGATVAELSRALLAFDPEATTREAEDYVGELIDHQVLVSELTPALTGSEPLAALLERQRQRSGLGAAVARLETVQSKLVAFDAHGLGIAPERYRALTDLLNTGSVPVDPTRLFQVDLAKPEAGTLGRGVIAEIVRGVALLHRLALPAEDPLVRFRQVFANRFGDTEHTRAVPLVEALDDETGVGFEGETLGPEASSLLEDLALPGRRAGAVSWDAATAHKLTLLTEALARGEQQIALQERDLERLASSAPPPLPDAFAVAARLAAASDEAVARGDFLLYLASITGPSGVRLLGRFCHVDPMLSAWVRRHLRQEEALRPDAVFAEIVHLPEGRVGNILARPVLRRFEIPYLGKAGVPDDCQLPVSDLLVSVVQDRVVLRSARLGKEVLPRLTSAHRYSNDHGIYRFLCAVQDQGTASRLGWDWGPLRSAAFLPRVTFGRLVLARAQWLVSAAEAEALLAGGQRERFTAVQRWRQQRRLPRWVCLTDHDNELPIDLDNPLMVETLQDQLSGGGLLTELFPEPDRLCAAGPEGRYVHELIVPFVCRAEKRAPDDAADGTLGALKQSESGIPTQPELGALTQAELGALTQAELGALTQPELGALTQAELGALTRPRSPCRRVFVPRSEWAYVKLYAGPITVDRLVRDVAGPLAAGAEAGGLIRRWFFVRYADPHVHLRLRFEGEPDRLQQELLPRLQEAIAPWLRDGRIWKVQLDTYEREVERYGGPEGTELCEQLFHADSLAAVGLLGLLEDDRRGERRWRLTLLGMDPLLADLGLDLEARRAILRRTRAAFGSEFGVDAACTHRLAARYRKETAALAELLDPGADPLGARVIFEERSRRLAPIAAGLRALEQTGRLTLPLARIAPPLLHMWANRLLLTAHRAQELVIYDFLSRLYQSQAARSAAPVAVSRKSVVLFNAVHAVEGEGRA